MFSSLEALDVDEHVDIAPVTRQGAFIPKAKPRVRKGANHSARIKHTEVIKQTNSPVSIANADEHIDQQIVTQVNAEPSVVQIEYIIQGRTDNSVGCLQQLSLQSSQLETDLGIQSGEVVEEKVSAKNLNDDVNANVRTITPPKEESTSTIPPLVKEVLVEDFFKTQENLVLSSDSKSEGHAIDTVYALSGGTLSYQQQIQGTCCTEKQEFVEKEHSLSTPISNEDFRGNAHNESLPSSSDLQPLQSECLLAPEGIGQIDLDDYITEINEMQAVEHVNKATIMSPQLKHVSLDLQSPQTEKEVAEVSSKIKIASEDGPDLCLAGNKVRQAHNVGAVEEITTSDHVTEENNNSFDDGNEQQDRMPDDQGPNFLENEKIGQLSVIGTSASGVEVGIADVSCQKSVMDDAAAPVKKKRHGSTPKRKRHDDGEELLNAGEKTSSMRIKKSRFLASSFANVQGSAREVATGTTADREENLEASSKGENKQETDNVQGQQDNGHSSTIPHTEKRRRRKPARYLDAADDDEKSYSLFSSASVKKSSRQSQIDKQGNVETELLSELFPSLPEKIAKLKKRENGSTNATLNGATAHTTAKGSRRAKGSSKSTTPKADKNEKKVFKKPVIQRRRVERCTINPADPDLDPKKLTMKEIIRLAAAKERISKKENAKNAKNKDQIASTDAEIEHENEASACFAPQVQIIDGQIVINEESLVINARRKDDIRTYKRVEETHAKLNYHSYMKRTPKQFWKPEETELFYKALREIGTNFSMIQHLFPGRTRKQVALKFKKEERCRPWRISEALRVKPCETSHFLEVMNTLDLLPSDAVDEFGTTETSITAETSLPEEMPSKKEKEDNDRISRRYDKQTADGDEVPLKKEDSVDALKQAEPGKGTVGSLDNEDTTGHCHYQELQTVDPSKATETSRTVKSPKRDPSPPRKKRPLFSYQLSANKS